MKTVLSSIIFVVLLSACNAKPDTQEKYPLGSFELGGAGGKDTLNIIDGNKLKQGLWVTRDGKDSMVYQNDTGYSTKGYTFGEVQRILKAGNKRLFLSYDSLAVKSR